MAGAIVAIVVVVFLLIVFSRTVRIVPRRGPESSSASGATTGP
jgi:hypothetical protein